MEKRRKKKTRWRRVTVGSGVRSRFLEPFNDIPEENEGGGLRMAAMELDFAGRRMANRVARSWKMRLCVLESHSLPYFPRARRVPLPYLSFPLSILRKYVSIYICARDHVIPCDRIVSGCTDRSLSDSEMRLTGPCGFVRTIRKNTAREERSYILLSLADINAILALIDSISRKTEERD